MKILALCILLSLQYSTSGQTLGSAADLDCKKCVLRKPALKVHLETKAEGEFKKVVALIAGAQRLPLSEPLVTAAPNKVEVGAIDLDFDGWQDIYLISDENPVNAQFEYFLFDPKKKQFHSAGRASKIIADAKSKSLTSTDLSGPESKTTEYTIQNGQLAEIEVQ